jgi:TP901 family phage tail tape measure protein
MAGGGTEVARAFVTIIPKSDGTSDSVVRSIVDPLARGGNDAGAKASQGFAGAMGAGLAKTGKMLGAIGLAAGVASFGKESVQAGMQFDASMAQVAATMGTTVDQIGDLREFAQQMGATTKFSASQSADALNYMALAGYDAQTSMAMLPNVLNLAAAGNMDLAQASDMVTDTQSALGLSLDETTALVDKMAAASSTTNTSVSQLGDALLTVGGTAKNLSGGTTEAAQALGLLADNGIKGSEGGTALRNVLLGLSSDKFEKTFGAMGVAAYDAEGNMRSLKDIFGDMNTAMADMTVEEKTEALSSAFNKVDLKSLNALLGTNAERWDEVSEKIDGSAGAAQKMADTQLDNLSGDVTTFQSALEGLQIKISDAITPALRGFTQLGTSALGGLTEAMGWVNEQLSAFGDALTSTIDFEGFKAAFDAVGQAISNAFGGTATVNVTSFGQMVGNVINGLVPVIQGAAPIIGGVASVVSAAVTYLSERINMLVAFVQQFVIPIATDVFNAVAPVMSQLASAVGDALSTVSGLFSEACTAVFGDAQANFPAMAATVRGAMSTVKAVVGPVLSTVRSVVSSVFNGVKSVASAVWPVVSGVVKTAAGAIKSAINGIKSVVGGVKSTFNSIKSAMTDPINKAKDTVKGVIDKIKGFFPLNIGKIFSNLQIPHISVNGGSPPFGIGGKGSLPSFNVNWHAKGAIFTKPTILGGTVGVGEAGPEAIMPIDRLPELLGMDDGQSDGRPNVYVGDISVSPSSALYDLLMELGETMVEDRRRGGKAVA